MATADLARRSAEQQAEFYYRDHAPYGPDVCVYCGDPADTVDHITPLVHVASICELVNVREKYRHGLYRVPCCRDCNSRLGAVMATTMTEKREILKARLRRKYRTLLASYDWTEEEINGLGFTLQVHIRKQERLRQRVLDRLGFPRPWEATLLRR